MEMTVGRLSCCRVAIGCMTLMFVLNVTSPAFANGCSAVGIFIFTLAGGSGRLSLGADGSVGMNYAPGHGSCEVCVAAAQLFTGTYQTTTTDQGCMFTIDLSKPPALRNQITGMVAFDGRVLLFLAATMPEFGAGLALRSDTFTGQ
jgi:hypothetical protein